MDLWRLCIAERNFVQYLREYRAVCLTIKIVTLMFGGFIRPFLREERAAAKKAADKMRSISAMSEDYKRAQMRKKRKK